MVPKLWRSLWLCRICLEGVVVSLRHTILIRPDAAPSFGPYNSPAKCPGDVRAQGFGVEAVHPKPPPIGAPEHVPPEIARDYESSSYY